MRQKLIILLCGLMTSLYAFAYDFAYTYQGTTFYFNKTSESTCEVTSGESDYSGDIVMPASANFKSSTFSVTSIGPWAFQKCTELTSIEIPGSVTSIGQSAFYRCSSLSSIEIPNSVISIGMLAFSSCTNLSSIEIPESVTSIGDYAFSNCFSLQSIKIPNSVTTISDGTFYTCLLLRSVEIPKSVTVIGNWAFEECYSLTTLIIPDAVISIGHRAFSVCKELKSIEIPNSVASIGNSAFSDCGNLTSIKVDNENPSNIELGNNVFSGLSMSTCTLYVPKGSKNAYEEAPQWKDFKNIVEIDFSDAGVDTIITDKISDKEGQYYDLTGRKVNNPERGIYIHNGKRIIKGNK